MPSLCIELPNAERTKIQTQARLSGSSLGLILKQRCTTLHEPMSKHYTCNATLASSQCRPTAIFIGLFISMLKYTPNYVFSNIYGGDSSNMFRIDIIEMS